MILDVDQCRKHKQQLQLYAKPFRQNKQRLQFGATPEMEGKKMLDVLSFVFSGFWVWLGTVILIGVLAGAIAEVIWALRGLPGPVRSRVRAEKRPSQIGTQGGQMNV